MSRVLFSGNNQITMTFKEHEANAKANPIRAVGVDVVKYKNQCDFIVAHTHGKVFKVVDYITGHELDREQNGYGNYVLILHDNNIATISPTIVPSVVLPVFLDHIFSDVTLIFLHLNECPFITQ